MILLILDMVDIAMPLTYDQHLFIQPLAFRTMSIPTTIVTDPQAPTAIAAVSNHEVDGRARGNWMTERLRQRMMKILETYQEREPYLRMSSIHITKNHLQSSNRVSIIAHCYKMRRGMSILSHKGLKMALNQASLSVLSLYRSTGQHSMIFFTVHRYNSQASPYLIIKSSSVYVLTAV